ncbi:MAG TPA: M28 family peptidase [Gemmatimonadaceae bacterium]|nr:M28 family peptidase [Gemmatimonadaceae bacterium]
MRISHIRGAALVAAAVLVAGCSSATGRSVPGHAVLSERTDGDTTLLRRDINFLASDALQGRLTGTPGNDSAAAYIARRYELLGLETLTDSSTRDCIPVRSLARSLEKETGSQVALKTDDGAACPAPYFQPFDARSVAAAHAGLDTALATQNVVALIPGTDPSLKKQYVVIGAHFDHLGRLPFGAMDPGAGNAIRPGADDNASGTAAVMELARLFARKPARRSIIVANFSGEELGLLGSQHFVQHPPVPLQSIDAMLNFDMVGRMRDNKLIVYGVSTAEELSDIVDSANVTPPISVAARGDGYGPSDQSSFYAEGIPVLYFFTDLHEDYHRATDVASKIDVADEARIVNFAERIARRIADRPARLTYVRSAPPPQMTQGDGNGAWFGSIPDMSAADVVGVRLMGVTPGSPADKAGVRKGDVVVEFGGMKVKDLYQYTDALRAHKPGDEVEVVVERDGKRLTFAARLGARGS